MYETLAMIKPNSTFQWVDVRRIVTNAVDSQIASVEIDVDRFLILSRSGNLKIAWNEDDYVVEESDDIASQFSISCGGCEKRLEMNGDDPDMELFNIYLLINERLNETGHFVIFDSQECRLLLDD